MSNVPYPTLHAPTAKMRAAFFTKLYAAGIYWNGMRVMTSFSSAWEAIHGHNDWYMEYDRQGGWRMERVKRPDYVLVNSPDHFISYVRRHKLPLKS